MKQILGTLYLSACRQPVSDCGSTPLTPSNTTTAPSTTRRDLSTSTVQSPCPGVSIKFILCSHSLSPLADVGVQKQGVAAAVMVMPLSLSCSIQSITASPS